MNRDVCVCGVGVVLMHEMISNDERDQVDE